MNDKPNGRHTPHAQYHLGDAFYFGRGVEQDRSAASKWLSLAFIVPRPYHCNAMQSLATMHVTNYPHPLFLGG